MALLLYRLGKFSYRHRWWVVSFWLVVLLAVGGSAALFKGQLTNEFKIPGTETQRVIDHLKQALPEAAGGTASVVFQNKDGKPFTDEQKKAVSDALNKLNGTSQVQSSVDPFTTQAEVDAAPAKLAAAQKQLDAGKAQQEAGNKQLDDAKKQLDSAKAQAAAAQNSGVQVPAAQAEAAAAQIAAAEKDYNAGRAKADAAAKELAAHQAELDFNKRKSDASQGIRFVSKDDTVAVAQISFKGSLSALSTEDRDHVVNSLVATENTGLNVYPSKELSEDLGSLAGPAEIIGLCVAVLVLIIMLGTLIAAGLPLLMAIVGVGVGVGGTIALSGVIQMNSMTPILALMLGLAVGIDYSLFIVNRHRGQILSGMSMEESVARATGTSGNAVFFAGVTVVITLAALAVPGLPFLSLMGLAAAATVAVAVLVSLTLTPAVLGLVGKRVISKRGWRRAADSAAHPLADHDDAARGWGAWVTKWPWLAVVVSVVVLGVVALPAQKLHLALPDGGSEAADSTAYKAYSTISNAFGDGMNGPIVVVGEFPAGLSEQDAALKQLDLADRLRSVPGVVAALPATLSADRQTAVFQVIPTEGPASEKTVQVVADIRAKGADIQRDLGVKIGLTGQTTANIDVSNKLIEALPLYLSIVVGLSLILLLLVFRSIWVPVLATAGFLLSLAASFGAVVAVYQWGWLGSVFDVPHPGPILSMLPIILIGVLFGLAMDYQVFIGSGMREAYVHGAKAKAAVRIGFKHAAVVVTAAAIIMTSVFAGFIFNHLTMVRPLGFSLAFGVLVDAFVVRMTLIPAAMHLLGKRAWWLPAWLEKHLPDVDVEGARLNQDHREDSATTDDADGTAPALATAAAGVSAPAASGAGEAASAPAPAAASPAKAKKKAKGKRVVVEQPEEPHALTGSHALIQLPDAEPRELGNPIPGGRREARQRERLIATGMIPVVPAAGEEDSQRDDKQESDPVSADR
ncbi:MMPL family transporter [Arthrobacter sp. Y-9]|uniref:MMPL family transporter n=1 Tax=Arthrobacter sp. Y-9 TaxID=3039385 RepID=UPI00241C6F89|nr:MMPL family transporter [Arthrobacter sp. Y-9]WFR83931.1 MMPL family transporter [Arthrobacter sp. Y-9]